MNTEINQDVKHILNVVGYIRVSTNSQKDNTSPETQIEKITMYAKLHDYTLIKIYKDEGISGKDIADRKDYTDMLLHIDNKENNIGAIVVYKIDRLHRSARNLLNMIFSLNKLNVSLISVSESFINTSTSQGKLFVTMMAGFSELVDTLI